MSRSDEAAPAEVAAPPVLRVVRGTPDAAELAALLAVVSAAGAGDDPPRPPAGTAWASPRRTVRTELPAGGWRTSLAPH